MKTFHLCAAAIGCTGIVILSAQLPTPASAAGTSHPAAATRPTATAARPAHPESPAAAKADALDGDVLLNQISPRSRSRLTWLPAPLAQVARELVSLALVSERENLLAVAFRVRAWVKARALALVQVCQPAAERLPAEAAAR